jgi:hypothetical protein
MKKITQTLYPEGDNKTAYYLRNCLKEFFDQEAFDTGVDWQFEYLWAVMTDSQCLMFCLKHPEFTTRFKEV